MSDSARVTIVLNVLYAGGAARVAILIGNYWANTGRTVTILTTDDGRLPPLQSLHQDIQHVPLDLRRNLQSRLFQSVVRNSYRLWVLRRAIAQSHADVLISFLDVHNVKCLLATRGLRRIPVIISERTDPHGRPIGRAWEALRRVTYPWADCLVVQSRHALDYFPPSIKTKGVVIPNPVTVPNGDCAHHADLASPKSHYTLMALGRLSRIKGHDLLIDAFSRIISRHPDWALVIYGEGPCRSALEVQVRSLGLTQRVRLPGATADPFACLREADLFVLPSRTEGFPNALAEAMACGLPVVSFNCHSGPAELIRHGYDGVLVPAGDVDALAAAIDDLMGDPAERQRLGQHAPEVLERFSMKGVMGMWDAVLNSVVGSPNTSY